MSLRLVQKKKKKAFPIKYNNSSLFKFNTEKIRQMVSKAKLRLESTGDGRHLVIKKNGMPKGAILQTGSCLGGRNSLQSLRICWVGVGVTQRKASSSHDQLCQYGHLSSPGLILEISVEGSVSKVLRFVLSGSSEKRVLNRQGKRGACPICFGIGKRTRVFNRAHWCPEIGNPCPPLWAGSEEEEAVCLGKCPGCSTWPGWGGRTLQLSAGSSKQELQEINLFLAYSPCLFLGCVLWIFLFFS